MSLQFIHCLSRKKKSYFFNFFFSTWQQTLNIQAYNNIKSQSNWGKWATSLYNCSSTQFLQIIQTANLLELTILNTIHGTYTEELKNQTTQVTLSEEQERYSFLHSTSEELNPMFCKVMVNFVPVLKAYYDQWYSLHTHCVHVLHPIIWWLSRSSLTLFLRHSDISK